MLIELTRGKRTIIDAIDVDLAGRSWHAVPGHRSVGNYTFYAARRKGSKRITLHREILERILGRRLQEGEECDHIDGNGLNNRRSNLRLVDHRRNIRNSHNRKSITRAGERQKQLRLVIATS
ncbi:MAG TPA: HNH endonuclease [Methanothrix sp.]|nr:HNH endonuclease [Methanothrix sp.]